MAFLIRNSTIIYCINVPPVMYEIPLCAVCLETQSCRPITKLLIERLVTYHGIDYILLVNQFDIVCPCIILQYVYKPTRCTKFL